jgi:hypothetical protein
MAKRRRRTVSAVPDSRLVIALIDELFRVDRECLLGHDLVYVRRRADALCASEADVEDIRLERVCEGMSTRTRQTLGPLTSGTKAPDKVEISLAVDIEARNRSLTILGVTLGALVVVTAAIVVAMRFMRRRRPRLLPNLNTSGANVDYNSLLSDNNNDDDGAIADTVDNVLTQRSHSDGIIRDACK